MEIKKLVKEIHENAKSKGFWDNPRELGTLLMLVVSELGEALEADRKGNSGIECDVVEQCLDAKEMDKFVIQFERLVKGSVEEEIADTIIRLFDLCGGLNIDIEKFIKIKMAYNETRIKLHGKKY